MSLRRALARLGCVAGLAGLLVLAAPARGQAPAGPGPGAAAPTRPESALPAPTGYVNDLAGLMTESDRAKLEGFLDQVERKTGAEFAVLTVKTTGGVDPREYKVTVFNQWGIGKETDDEGLLLLVAVEEREVWFETGYGLEGTLPDGWQSRLVRREVRPRFREGDYAGGITQAMLVSAARVAKEKGVTLEWDGRELRYDERDSGGIPPAVLVLLLVLFVLIMVAAANASRGGRGRGGRGSGGFGGPVIIGGSGWGGGWGGSFSGSGGGPSFGGFGGGSSGGGGGGGSW